MLTPQVCIRTGSKSGFMGNWNWNLRYLKSNFVLTQNQNLILESHPLLLLLRSHSCVGLPSFTLIVVFLHEELFYLHKIYRDRSISTLNRGREASCSDNLLDISPRNYHQTHIRYEISEKFLFPSLAVIKVRGKPSIKEHFKISNRHSSMLLSGFSRIEKNQRRYPFVLCHLQTDAKMKSSKISSFSLSLPSSRQLINYEFIHSFSNNG